MIIANTMTLIGEIPYNCVKIEDNMAYLKKVGEESRGRFKVMPVDMVPYVIDGKLIIPKPKPASRKRMTRFHYMKVIKEEVDLPLSHDLAYFIAEQLDTLVRNLAGKAQQNAEYRDDDRITSAHWYNLQLGLHQGDGYWPSHVEYAKDYKEYLTYDTMKSSDE